MNERNENKPPFESLLELPLISRYRVITFYGTADGTVLNQGFDIEDFRNRTLVIKSVQLVPYVGASITYMDFFVSDGTVNNEETLPSGIRITRVLDRFGSGARIDFLINGTPIGIFPSSAVRGYPLDLHIDNIYYWYKEKIDTFDVSVLSVVMNARTGASGTPQIKVVVEVYII